MRSKSQRKRDNFEHAYHSQERIDFVRSLACIVPGCRRRATNAHTEAGGVGMKAHHSTVAPICQEHHDESHLGVKTFERKYGVDLRACAAETHAKWLAYDEMPW